MTDPTPINTETRYAVGWVDLDAQSVADSIRSAWPEEANQITVLRRYGRGRYSTFLTPGEAQGFLDHVCRINSENNLKAVNGIGAQGFFIIEIKPLYPDLPDPWSGGTSMARYDSRDHVIPIPFYEADFQARNAE